MTIPDEEAVKLPVSGDLDLVADLRRLAAATRGCTVCDGYGIKDNGNECGGCGGTGKVPAWWGVHKTLAAAADAIDRLSALSPTTPDTQAPGSGEVVTEAMLDRAAAGFEHGVTAQTQDYDFKHTPTGGWLFRCGEWFNLSDALRAAMLASAPSASIGDMGAGEITVPARDGFEAQRGINDIFPGDPYPISDDLKRGIDNLRAKASRGGLTSAEVFAITDPLMDLLVRSNRRQRPTLPAETQAGDNEEMKK